MSRAPAYIYLSLIYRQRQNPIDGIEQRVLAASVGADDVTISCDSSDTARTPRTFHIQLFGKSE